MTNYYIRFVIAVVYQKRLKKERRVRKQVQDQLDLEIKRRAQLEDALKATGATPEQVRAITGNSFIRKKSFIQQNSDLNENFAMKQLVEAEYKFSSLITRPLI